MTTRGFFSAPIWKQSAARPIAYFKAKCISARDFSLPERGRVIQPGDSVVSANRVIRPRRAEQKKSP
jgi:hypothetical protein